MRICVVYDGLFPYNIGGAERWYRDLAERLAADGHELTYLTMRQWEPAQPPAVPGVRVVAAAPFLPVYVGGRRSIARPLVFGAGVGWHLLRRGHRYDVVHTMSFPYFSLLAAGALRPLGRYRLVVDWFEVWSRAYWREYLGRVGGRVGWLVQRLCLAIPQRAFSFSRLHAARLRADGYRGPITVLRGLYAGTASPPSPEPAEPIVVFAGRHIPEKQVPAIVPAVALARRTIPNLRAVIFGDGPERAEVERQVATHGLNDVIDIPGFVDDATVAGTLGRALCLVLPSRREGYGLVVVEAAARGVPSVVAPSPDNAAVELVADGENGVVARSASPEDLATAIERVYEAGPSLRDSTADWFARNAAELSLRRSLDVLVASYGDRDRTTSTPSSSTPSSSTPAR